MSQTNVSGDTLLSSISSALKFSGNNFALWKMKMLAYMEDKELLEALLDDPITINGTKYGKAKTISLLGKTKEEVKSDATANKESAAKDEKIKELQKKAMKAYTILILSLQDEQLQLIIDVPRGNAYGVWTRLLQRYERNTVASKTQARNMLNQCKMKNEESVDSYISRIQRLVMSLSEMGSVLSNDDSMVYLKHMGH
jgi:hypothetical protein